MEEKVQFLNDDLDYKVVFERLVDDLDAYTTKAKLKSVVLGISGGIDSTVVAAIASEVVKRKKARGEKFYLAGITMPSRTTDPMELIVAKEVMHTFCETGAEVDIDIFASKFNGEVLSIPGGMGRDICGNFSSPEKIALRQGNIKSRLRMIILYDAAKSCDGMVLGTDNMSEYLLGFSTIGGDALFDYCPIQELWKTEVFGLAEYIRNMFYERDEFKDRKKSKAITDSLCLKPMDGLGISADDMEQIGAKDYYEVDKILKEIWKSENSQETLGLELGSLKIDGIPDETVSKVLSRYKANRYKRFLPYYPEREEYSDGMDICLYGIDPEEYGRPEENI